MDEDMEFESAAAIFQQAHQEYQNPPANRSGERKMLYVRVRCVPLQ